MTGARLVKRMAFALLSGETDQYVSFLPDIQGTCSEECVSVCVCVCVWEGVVVCVCVCVCVAGGSMLITVRCGCAVDS